MIAKVGFCTCLLLGAALAAVGQSKRENLKKCVSSDPDTSIAGCTALIQAGRESTAALVGAYSRRGSAYMQKGDYDHAIQDYDDAIRLNPNDAPAYNDRGSAYFYKGDYDRAIQDFNEAIRLNPNFVEAYYNRGDACLFQSNLTAAMADFEHVISAEPSSSMVVYAALMLHVAMKRQGRDDAQQLAPVAQAADLSKWPGPLLKLDLGQMGADEVMAVQPMPAPICRSGRFAKQTTSPARTRYCIINRLRRWRGSGPRATAAPRATLGTTMLWRN